MKNYDEQRAFALLQKIGFTRVAGSPEEAKAAEILKAECESFGLAAAIEPFEIETGEVEASFEVLEPYRKSYTVRGYQCAENTPEALPMIIEMIKSEGYKIVPISRILLKGDYETDVQGKMRAVSEASSGD